MINPEDGLWDRVDGPEHNDGNVEYKLYLGSPSSDRIDRLATQMRYRLAQGGGEAFYELGVSDDGELIGIEENSLQSVLSTFDRVAKLANAEWRITRREKGRIGDVLEIHLRQKLDTPVQIIVPLLGNVDSGKSTLVGVLCTGELDNGDGECASKVARYLHEIVNRRTSSVSTRLLGFDGSGAVANEQLLDPLNESQVYLKSKKVIVFVDLAGHERYLRTTLKGVLGHTPDYALVVVASNMGTVGTFKEHVGISVVLGIPFAVVITKTDLDPYNVKKTVGDITSVLKIPGVNKIPFIVNSLNDAVLAARHMSSGRVTPVFSVSNVTASGLGNLKTFLDLLPPRLEWDKKVDMNLVVYIDDKFLVKGTGLVVSGMINQGRVAQDEEVQLGPFIDGGFRRVKVKSLHLNRVNVMSAKAGQIVSLALSGTEYDEVEKGMVILDNRLKPFAVRELEADIHVLYHPTTIKRGYQSVLHLQTHRQPAQIVSIIGKTTLRTGDKGRVVMRLLKRPAYVVRGQTLIFREGRTKGIGKVTEVYPLRLNTL
jgi:elongation factor 1-alpha